MIYLLCIGKVYKFLLEKILTLAGSISALFFFIFEVISSDWHLTERKMAPREKTENQSITGGP
jgi:hypothetical protein